jgi:hypothetical protein
VTASAPGKRTRLLVRRVPARNVATLTSMKPKAGRKEPGGPSKKSLIVLSQVPSGGRRETCTQSQGTNQPSVAANMKKEMRNQVPTSKTIPLTNTVLPGGFHPTIESAICVDT